jgi:hypothetical protein
MEGRLRWMTAMEVRSTFQEQECLHWKEVLNSPAMVVTTVLSKTPAEESRCCSPGSEE